MKIAEFFLWQLLVLSLISSRKRASKHKLYLNFNKKKSTQKIVPSVRRYNSS